MTGSPGAPTVTTPVPAAIVAAAKRIVRAVDPLQVILFGSQARGDTHEWSDVDLLVVVPDGRDLQEYEHSFERLLRCLL